MERIRTMSSGFNAAVIDLCFCLLCLCLCLTQQLQHNGAVLVSAFSRVGSTTRNPRALRSVLEAGGPGGGDFGELTSALATLDQQWQIQQQSSAADGRGKPRWSKLILPKEEEEEVEDSDDSGYNREQSPFAKKTQDEYVWRLDPPSNAIPSCVIVFIGGAGLGQYPQVAYNELLSKISDKLNAVCITAPYEVGLDHFGLAKQTGERTRRALLVLNDENENEGRSRLPTYSLAHSLGCKLQTIYMAATGLESSFDGIGFVAYNNFSFAKTITMARSFAQELRGGTNTVGAMGNPEMINSIFDFAEMAVGAIGVDFSPNSQDTERLIQMRYNEEVQAKTRLFVFADDTLDSSTEFRAACESFGDGNSGGNLRVSNLPGGHLTPVFFRWNVDELAKDAMGGLGDTVSAENINMAKEAMGGFQGASFGDEKNVNALVDEVCDWVLGKPPSTASIPQISSSSSSSSSES